MFLAINSIFAIFLLFFRHVRKTKLPPKKELSPSAYRKTYDNNKDKVRSRNIMALVNMRVPH